MTTDQKNMYVAEKLGFCWYDWKCESSSTKPDFFDRDRIKLIELMEARPDGQLFFATLVYGRDDNVEAVDDDGLIPREYVTQPGKLLDAVYEWFAYIPASRPADDK